MGDDAAGVGIIYQAWQIMLAASCNANQLKNRGIDIWMMTRQAQGSCASARPYHGQWRTSWQD